MTALHPFSRRGIYLIDGIGSLALGVVLGVLAGTVAPLIGTLLTPAVVTGIGGFLAAWGLFNLWIARQPAFPRAAALANAVGDLLWIVASIALALAVPAGFTAFGLAVLVVSAVGVGAVLITKLAGLRAGRSVA